MTLDLEDVKALDVRIEGQARLVFAGALRMQAMGLRTQADLAMAMARTLDAQADAIEDGREPLPQRPVRMVVVSDAEPESESAPAPDPTLVQRIATSEVGNAGIFSPLDNELFTPAMAAFLDLFDDRLRLDDFFVGAVNDAAARGMPAEQQTAEWVQGRVYARQNAAGLRERRGGDGGE